MSEKIQYRTQPLGYGQEWSEWKDYDGSFYADGYIQMQKVRDYKEGTVLIVTGRGLVTNYVVLSGEVYTESINGQMKEFIACKVVYEDGDWSLDFVAKDRLDNYEIKGE